MKFCSLFINKFGKYCIRVRSLIKNELKVVKSVDNLPLQQAKNILLSHGVDPQSLESAILQLEEQGQTHVDFNTKGMIGWMEFTLTNH